MASLLIIDKVEVSMVPDLDSVLFELSSKNGIEQGGLVSIDAAMDLVRTLAAALGSTSDILFPVDVQGA